MDFAGPLPQNTVFFVFAWIKGYQAPSVAFGLAVFL
jgi:hypothetical protein